MYKQAQSVFDYLVVILPDVQKKMVIKDQINPKAAKTLFSIWKDEENSIDDKGFKRPDGLSGSDIEEMEKAGLVTSTGDRCEITEKGANVIRIMVLGDSRSVFEEDDKVVPYEQALAQSKQPNTRIAGRKCLTAQSSQRKHADNWWDRFLNK